MSSSVYVTHVNSYWHTQPVHLISPTLNLPDTLIKHFSHSPSGKHPCCLSRTSGTNHLAAQVPLTPALQFSNCRRPVRTPASIRLSSARYTLVFDHRLTIVFGCAFGYSLLVFAMDKDTYNAKDVPATAASVPSSPSTPTTSATADVSARRSCPRFARRMSSL